MKKLIFFIILAAAILIVLIRNTSNVVVMQVKEKPEHIIQVDKNKEREVVVVAKIDPIVTKEKNTFQKITEDVNVYLQDDINQLKIGMTLIHVDRVWGKPDEFKRLNENSRNIDVWEYGNFWASDSKLEGIFYYKIARFVDGKLKYNITKSIIKIKTHTRNDVVKSHLDESGFLRIGMSKLEVYKLWGLPYKSEVFYYTSSLVQTRWDFRIEDNLSHYCIFENNKLTRWEDY